jgi:hypothetical protein
MRRLGLTDEEMMAARLGELGKAYGAPRMRAIVASGVLAQESEPERDLLGVFRPGDPLPDAQVWVSHRSKWHRLDFSYLDVRLAIEYDGAQHDGQREQDADRDLALLELQIATIRVTKSMMRDPEDTRRRILAVRSSRLPLGLKPLVPDRPPWA